MKEENEMENISPIKIQKTGIISILGEAIKTIESQKTVKIKFREIIEKYDNFIQEGKTSCRKHNEKHHL